MNKNAVRTSLIFLGIIFFVLMGRLFFNQHELLVISDQPTQSANSSCVGENELC